MIYQIKAKTTNTTNIKDLQEKITALSVSQTQVLAGSI
jgi:hypothetical protein